MGERANESYYSRLYDEQAAEYDERRFAGRRGRFDRDLKNALIVECLRTRGVLDDAVIYDFAAGTGRITHELASHPVRRIVAVDVSPGMLEENERTLAPQNRSRVEFRVADMKDTGLPAGSADAATAGSFFHLVPLSDYPDYAQAMARVLRPGGILVAEVSNALMLLNPRNYLRVVVHRHVRAKAVTSHPYPWERRRLFPGFQLDEVIGVSYPVVTRSISAYARYSRRLGAIPVTRSLGGKCLLVLRKQ